MAYEITGNVGGDRDLTREEKHHLGGYGGGGVGSFFSTLENMAMAPVRVATSFLPIPHGARRRRRRHHPMMNQGQQPAWQNPQGPWQQAQQPARGWHPAPPINIT